MTLHSTYPVSKDKEKKLPYIEPCTIRKLCIKNLIHSLTYLPTTTRTSSYVFGKNNESENGYLNRVTERLRTRGPEDSKVSSEHLLTENK